MGESSAFTTGASFVEPAEEDTHAHTYTHTSVKLEEGAIAAGGLSLAFKVHELVPPLW